MASPFTFKFSAILPIISFDIFLTEVFPDNDTSLGLTVYSSHRILKWVQRFIDRKSIWLTTRSHLHRWCPVRTEAAVRKWNTGGLIYYRLTCCFILMSCSVNLGRRRPTVQYFKDMLGIIWGLMFTWLFSSDTFVIVIWDMLHIWRHFTWFCSLVF